MQDFRNLDVWRSARKLTQAVYEMTMEFPESETFGLRLQMRRASVSICSNIAEGCGRRGDREFRRFLDVAMGSACELECEAILSFDLAFITAAIQDTILEAIIEIKRMLGGLIRRLVCGPSPRRLEREQRTVSATSSSPRKPLPRADS